MENFTRYLTYRPLLWKFSEEKRDEMAKRYVSVWFRYLKTDWFSLSQPQLKKLPFVLRTPSHGRMMITGANETAERNGITTGMVLADARAIIPDLEVLDDKPDLPQKLLRKLAEWCIRFSPVVSVDIPDGLIIDATGCTHLWGGEENYLFDIIKRLNARGYDARAAIADTIGVAWAVSRFGKGNLVIQPGNHFEALFPLPPEALRLEEDSAVRLHRLGLHRVSQFINIPRASLRRRFGKHLLFRIDAALGKEDETITPVITPEPYQERLPCLDPIITATGIAIALDQLLQVLCLRMMQDQKGLRNAVFKCYRVDGKVVQIDIATNRASYHVSHLFKLFELKLASIDPGLGIELFVLDATKIEEYFSSQEKIWEDKGGLDDMRLSELIDRLAGKLGNDCIHRYLPDEHYWPERSYKPTTFLQEKSTVPWRIDKLRPLQVLKNPDRIEVTAPIPDYPPMLFRYKGKIHKIVKADGPERIEQEWWLQQGQHRDYYCVEDEEGFRYWLFRLGHYDDKFYQWFIHGFFA
jgi:protein ImuB